MGITIETLNYETDGAAFGGRLMRPEPNGRPRAAVLVFAEADGLGPHALERAERLATEGYVSLAVDMYGGEAQLTSLEDIGRAIEGFAAAPHRLLNRAGAALTRLCEQPDVDPQRVGAIGFCYGGLVALELARAGAAIRAVVGFHPSLQPLSTPPSPVLCPVLICVGSDDPLAPADDRLAFEVEMRTAGCEWQMLLFGQTKHSFTNKAADARALPALAYSEQADAVSWQAMKGFLERHLDG